MTISDGFEFRGTWCKDIIKSVFTDVEITSVGLNTIRRNQCANVDMVLGTSSVDRLINFETNEATLQIVDEATVVRSRLTEGEPGNRKSKPTECWVAYQTSQLEMQWMSSCIQSEMLWLLESRCCKLMKCSGC